MRAPPGSGPDEPGILLPRVQIIVARRLEAGVTVRVVALDDYQGLVERYSLAGRPDGAEWAAVREHLDGADALVRALDGAAVIVAMRERTRFGRELLARLPDRRPPITTGLRNASIDLQAAADQGVVVCGTSGPPSANTAELTWAPSSPSPATCPRRGTRSARAGGSAPWAGPAGLHSGPGGLGRSAPGGPRRAGLRDGGDRLEPESGHGSRRRGGRPPGQEAGTVRAADVVSVHLQLTDRTRGLVSVLSYWP